MSFDVGNSLSPLSGVKLVKAHVNEQTGDGKVDRHYRFLAPYDAQPGDLVHLIPTVQGLVNKDGSVSVSQNQLKLNGGSVAPGDLWLKQAMGQVPTPINSAFGPVRFDVVG